MQNLVLNGNFTVPGSPVPPPDPTPVFENWRDFGGRVARQSPGFNDLPFAASIFANNPDDPFFALNQVIDYPTPGSYTLTFYVKVDDVFPADSYFEIDNDIISFQIPLRELPVGKYAYRSFNYNVTQDDIDDGPELSFRVIGGTVTLDEVSIIFNPVLLQNANFETPGQGNTLFANWTNNNFVFVDTGFDSARSAQLRYLTAANVGIISQSISLPVSGAYTVQFYAKTSIADPQYQLNVLINDVIVNAIPLSNFVPNTFIPYYVSINGTVSTNKIGFSISGGDDLNPASVSIDNISLSQQLNSIINGNFEIDGISKPFFAWNTIGDVIVGPGYMGGRAAQLRFSTGDSIELSTQFPTFIPTLPVGPYMISVYLAVSEQRADTSVVITYGPQQFIIPFNQIASNAYTQYVFTIDNLINAPLRFGYIGGTGSLVSYLVDNVSLVSVNAIPNVICYSGDSLVLTKNIKTCKIENIPAKNVYSNLHHVYNTSQKKFVPVRLNIVSGPTSKFRILVKDSLGLGKPSADFYVTPGHKILINGVSTKVRDIPQAKRVKNKFEKVYSICTDVHGPILVNGLETMAWSYSEWMHKAAKSGIYWNDNKNTLNISSTY